MLCLRYSEQGILSKMRMFADGPLFDAMRGRKWVLSVNAAQVTSGNALANLFALPEKDFIAAVAFAPLQGSVSLVLHLPGQCATPKATALSPGNQQPAKAGAVSSSKACDPGGWEDGSACLALQLQFGGAVEGQVAGNVTSAAALVRLSCG